MASAEGEVQEKNYTATFPLLLNIKGAPTYFISLKDNAGLIKMYAFIDAKITKMYQLEILFYRPIMHTLMNPV